MSNTNNTITLLSQMSQEWRDKSELLELAQQIVQDLIEETGEEKKFIQDVDDFFPRLKNRINGTEKLEVVPTGFKDIDARVYWVAKWNIMTIAARTWGWKTTLWLNMAVNMCQNYKVGFISLEMTKEELLDKIVSQVCRVKSSSLTINHFSATDIQNLKEFGDKAVDISKKITLAFDCFFIDDIVTCMNQMADLGIEVIFLDRLGMVEARGQNKPEQMREIMAKIKQVALSRNIAIVAMQQLWRQVDGDDPRWPFMRDISDGSAIEKVSSPVLIMRRSWDVDKTTDIRLFKMRRLNSDLLEQMYQKTSDAWYEFANLKLWEDLSYCQFTDYIPPLPTNHYDEWTKPF